VVQGRRSLLVAPTQLPGFVLQYFLKRDRTRECNWEWLSFEGYGLQSVRTHSDKFLVREPEGAAAFRLLNSAKNIKAALAADF